MIQLSKYLQPDTYLYQYMQQNLTKNTNILGDFWTGIVNIQNLVKHIPLFINNQPAIRLNGLYFFGSERCYDFLTFYKDVLSYKNDNMHTDLGSKVLQELKPMIIISNICDLEIKDLIKIKNKFIQTYERKENDRDYTLSSMFCGSIGDYFTLLGSQSEKGCGILAYSLPIFCNKPKLIETREPTESNQRECFEQLVQFATGIQQFKLTSAGFQHYRKYITCRTREKGFYGSITEDLKNFYCLKLAAFLAFNRKSLTVEADDVDIAIKILNVTQDRAMEVYRTEIHEDDYAGKIEIAIQKIKNALIIEGLNGLPHRKLYMKVHHDIDNETFRYIINLMHELGLIEKLQQSSTAFIYRASDTLENLDITEFLKEVKELS